jgi:SAM-dependent methyltransferase
MMEEARVLDKVPGPDAKGREAMYYAHRQDEAHRSGAYGYLSSIAMVPRLATIGAYARAFGVRRLLDVGCGAGDLAAYLDPAIGYVGVDIAPTAITQARNRFGARADTEFAVADFRAWDCPVPVDCVVWAGIGGTWTRRGLRGDARDWLEILEAAERPLVPGGTLILELVTPHWPTLEGLIEGRYAYEAGCDLDCFQSDESPRRSMRVLRAAGSRPVDLPGRPPLPEGRARDLIQRAARMGQAVDEERLDLGLGYVYYGLTRLLKPRDAVCIGSYRGFAPLCIALALADEGSGMCHFIDPGLVDRYWHEPGRADALARDFGVSGHLRHLRMTSEQAAADPSLPPAIDLLMIDGDHSYDAVKFDFDRLGGRVGPDGYVLLHDSTVEGRGFTPWEVKRFLQSEVAARPGFEVLTLPFGAGLTVVRRRGEAGA